MQRAENLVGNWTWGTAEISQESILMEAASHKIIIFFIKPSDSNLTGICVCVCVAHMKSLGTNTRVRLVQFRRWGVSFRGVR